MKTLIPAFLFALLLGCGSNDVPFNTKTNVSYSDDGYDYKLTVLAKPIRGGIEIDIENLGIEPIVLDAECAIYEDESGKEIQAANRFFTRPPGLTILMDSRNFQVKSGEMNFAGIVPPPTAVRLSFKNFDKNKTLFKVALR